MNCRSLSVCGLFLAFAACSSQPSTPPTTPAGRGPASASAAVDDYEAMKTVLTFTPAQRQAFETKLAARNAGYQQWLTSATGQQYTKTLAAQAEARAAGNFQRTSELGTELRPLQREQESVRTKLRTDFDTVLTLDQQKQWAGYQLYTKIMRQFASLNMTAQQQAKSRAICDGIASKAVDKDTYQNDPYLALGTTEEAAATSAIRQDVLTAEQRAASTRPASRPSTFGRRGAFGPTSRSTTRPTSRSTGA